jgi:hypothetical protein
MPSGRAPGWRRLQRARTVWLPERTSARGRCQQIAERYDWDDVAARYGQICERLAAGADWPAGCEAVRTPERH